MGSERKSCRSLRFTSDVLTRLVASLPRTLLREQWLDAFRSDHSKLPSEIDVSQYSDWREFACDYLIVNLASKLDCLDLAVDRTAGLFGSKELVERDSLTIDREVETIKLGSKIDNKVIARKLPQV